MIRLLFCIIALATNAASAGCHFGYVGEHGVDHWGEDYSECLGKHQSPINIDSEHVTSASFLPFTITGFEYTPASYLANNGHTAMMTIETGTKPMISGGPLRGYYVFEQLHFHWGEDDFCGGENEINGKKYPLELHMVFYNKDYSDVNTALGHSDGLCVLGSLFEIDTCDNDNYSGIVKALGEICEAETSTKIDNPPCLFQLMPQDWTYFAYNGSLTTPPCTEAVTWIDFDNVVKISHKQLQAFRCLIDSECNKLVNNFRAIQPLGDREVFYCSNKN